MARSAKYRQAKRGQRMIELKVCFWTNDHADTKGYIWPKHGWTTGEVRITRNEPHGIIPVGGQKFGSLMEIPSAIEKVLMKHDIQLHRCPKMDNYVV